MTPALFYVDTLPPGDSVLLLGDEGRHAARVRRLAPGECVQIGDAAGTVLDCTVAQVRPDGLLLHARSRCTVPVPDPRLVVVQALPKGERAELAVESMTELGVDEIVPWQASRSITQWHGPRADKALARWRRVAREAAKQSRRPWVPSVAPVETTGQVTARLATASGGLVLHESATSALASCPVPSTGVLVVVVGPEGGISDDELERFAAAGSSAVRLGDAVLRTSTAGAAALAALSLRLGRWS